MKPSSPYLNREAQAMREAGQTTIRPATAWVLVAVFLAVICAVPLIQQVHDMRLRLAGERASAWPQCYDIFSRVPAAFAVLIHTPGSPLTRVLVANRRLLREMHAYEDALEDESVVNQRVRPPVQYVLSRWLGAGNEKAYCGVRSWLFYRADVDYLTGPGFLNPVQLACRAAGGNEWTSVPQPDPRPAILAFHQQLEERGIKLIVMPIPPKSVIQPDKFVHRNFEVLWPRSMIADSGLSGVADPGHSKSYPAVEFQNPSYAAFIRDLQQAGVLVADVTFVLAGVRSGRGVGGDAYLAADTHWRPETIEVAARYLKQYIDRNVPLPTRSLPASGVGMPAPPEASKYRAQTADVTNRGDLAVMLRLPEWTRGYPSESVRLRQILTARGEYWRPDETSDVLVLGDSFCNIYSLDAMGWGESAGLIEQLSFELQRPLDRLVINDNGAYATRSLLARELARGRDRLAGKRLVIWQFAMRELASGDWKSVALTLGKPASDLFVVPAPGKDLSVRGVVRAIAPVPRPGTVPYKDHIVAVHIMDLETSQTAIRDGQAFVYLSSMRDNVWTPAARLRPGETVTMRLRPWSDVAPRYERINRTELSDDALQLAEPCWGELITTGR
ncbi:MAG: hypothetical protein KJ964_12910 [Verrucomicrobia bacterium]|nr:hypothetical protein [Verrucomicrobiota bacterium]MBU1734410.1 hypothetical protein [Verrucomicrobiota bacterium]MBU1857316.1 hypothetical protein [Verrucomicrobiota bacterium]